LNRPGFDGGHGCVLHAEATRQDESPLDWKPSICWQLPLKLESDGDVTRVRGWLRSDWGPEGDDMAWCCTERETNADAFVGDAPVIESLRPELDALLGAELVETLAAALDVDE